MQRRLYRKPFHSPTIADAAVGPFMEDMRRAETLYLACGLHDTIRANNAAADHGLTTSSFAFADTRLLFNCIVAAAEAGVRRICFDVLVLLNEKFGRAWGCNEAECATLFLLESDQFLLPELGAHVAEVARRRDRAQQLVSEAMRVMGEPIVFGSVIDGASHPRVTIAPHLRRRKARLTHVA